ncbi:MAG TPA: fused MFS/spermidine synthase [Steroidobacteraceae bacterium]|nr:fused MFS/spermidine synthase [Steroidobacteraceae bacterium]
MKLARSFALFCAFAASMVASAAWPESMKLLHEERSLYREVLVYQTGDVRCMCFTRWCRIGRQTCVDMKHPRRIVMSYPQFMLSSLYVNPNPRSILLIGLGGGTLPRAINELLPDAQLDIVEIDPAVVRVAKQFFGFAENAHTQVIESDGRVYVKRARREARTYDWILLDAFDHEYIPEHLLTREFITEVKSILNSNGVLTANTFSSSRLYDHESATYAAVFPQFFNLKSGNRVIIARNGPLPDAQALRASSRAWEAKFDALGFERSNLSGMFSRRVDWNQRARVLTDQYSPANLLNTRE